MFSRIQKSEYEKIYKQTMAQQTKQSPKPVFEYKALLEYRYTHLFRYCLYLLSQYIGRTEYS